MNILLLNVEVFMKASNNSFSDFLNFDRQYTIPVFQRAYSWEIEHCSKFFDDIVSIAMDDKRTCHFVGSIIYLVLTNFSSTNECAIIDGQQRLTTLSLLLLALSKYTKEYFVEDEEAYKDSDANQDIILPFLETKKKNKGDLRFKLKLVGDDFKVYKFLVNQLTRFLEDGIIEKLPDNSYENSRIYRNYKYLYDRLTKNKFEPDLIMKGIYKLMIVDMPLDVTDNAQLVFETVNNTGKKLSQPQLVKNYILMHVLPEQQKDLYENYWQPVESELSDNEFETFFKYFLIVKTQNKVFIKDYYTDFKNFAISSQIPVEDIVKEMKQFAAYYLRWKNAENKNTRLDNIIVNIKETGVNQIVPTIMKLLFDLGQGLCKESEVVAILDIIESYLMRRKICAMPTNTTSDVCLKFLKSLIKVEEQAEASTHIDRIINCINTLTPAQRMPTDAELTTMVYTVNIYSNGNLARKLLDKIEAHENKDYTYSSNHSIEHIMPQTIQSHEELYKRTDYTVEKKEMVDWAIDLGENWQYVHETYVHTLGNLTLTGYNSEYQNYRFKYKKEMKNGFNDSPIRITKMLTDETKWGEDEIKARAKKLSEIITDIWKYPISQSE